MAALLLLLLISLAAIHWLIESWMHPLQVLLELDWLPWLAAAAGTWLLAGATHD